MSSPDALGSGYTGPTVADGRVYVMDRVVKPSRQERVQCFDAEKGTPLASRSSGSGRSGCFTASRRTT